MLLIKFDENKKLALIGGIDFRRFIALPQSLNFLCVSTLQSRWIPTTGSE